MTFDQPKRTEPSWTLHREPNRYIPWWKTDVQATWRRFGWVPRSEAKPDEVAEKWGNVV